MTGNEEVILLIKKVIKKIRNDSNTWDLAKSAGLNPNRLTVFRMSSAAGNHLFDDHYYVFGLTENEGSVIRRYFQTHNFKEIEQDFLKELIPIFNSDI